LESAQLSEILARACTQEIRDTISKELSGAVHTGVEVHRINSEISGLVE